MKKLLEQNCVMVKLDVLESEGKKELETPGGMAVLERLKGKTAGLPFMAVLNPDGKMLINSNPRKEGTEGNTGYPAAPEEIDWFMKMVKETAPRMTVAQQAAMKAWLVQNAPKQG